jgi:predicted ribosomally synthesized peptide with SipW-like signal peptide
MEEKTMKKKLILGILAAALSLTLAISGTLMLFTAESKEATNVVTLGNLEIALQEKGGTPGETTESTGDNPKTVGNTYDGKIFNGIQFGVVQPNQKITKAPRVVHTGGVDAYLRVRAEVKVFESFDSTEEVDWNDELTEKQREFLGEMIMSAGLKDKADDRGMHFGDEWTYVPGTVDSIGYFYYTDEENWGEDIDQKSLKVFKDSGDPDHPTETGYIFDTFVVPNWDQSELDELGGLLGTYRIEFRLQAQAVQATYNDGGSADDSMTWDDIFSGLGD